jgi:hypothetical protein
MNVSRTTKLEEVTLVERFQSTAQFIIKRLPREGVISPAFLDHRW